MKITKITKVGKKKVYDISVDDAEHYVLENGVITHNTGLIYSSDNIWIMGRRQEKEGTEVIGYNFIVNVEKSRFVKEKSKIPIAVTFDGGVSKYSGLIDMAIEGGFVYKPKNGWYRGRDAKLIKAVPKDSTYEEINGHADLHDKSYRLADTNSSEFWNPVLNDTDFKDWIKNKYQLGQIKLLTEKDEITDVEITEEATEIE